MVDFGKLRVPQAVTTLLEINRRLKLIETGGGIEAAQEKIMFLAKQFRDSIKDMPFKYVSDSPSNAVTALHPLNVNAKNIIETMKKDYHMWICPNGGELSEKVFRVGHIGHIMPNENAQLIAAFKDMFKRGLL